MIVLSLSLRMSLYCTNGQYSRGVRPLSRSPYPERRKGRIPLLPTQAHTDTISLHKHAAASRTPEYHSTPDRERRIARLPGGQRTMGMDIGLMMDSDYQEGQTQREAFD